MLQIPSFNEMGVLAIFLGPSQIFCSVLQTKAQMLGHNHHITVESYQGGAKLDIGAMDWHSLPSFDAWVIKLEYLQTEHRNPVKELIKQGVLDVNGRPVALNGGGDEDEVESNRLKKHRYDY